MKSTEGRATAKASVKDSNPCASELTMIVILLENLVEMLKARMHNMDQKATVIWPGPEMRQILCACPRVFWWFCLHFWCLLRFRAGAQKLAQKWCALPGSLEYSFTPSRALFFATKTLSKNDQKIRDLELDQITVAKWSNSTNEVLIV